MAATHVWKRSNALVRTQPVKIQDLLKEEISSLATQEWITPGFRVFWQPPINHRHSILSMREKNYQSWWYFIALKEMDPDGQKKSRGASGVRVAAARLKIWLQCHRPSTEARPGLGPALVFLWWITTPFCLLEIVRSLWPLAYKSTCPWPLFRGDSRPQLRQWNHMVIFIPSIKLN